MSAAVSNSLFGAVDAAVQEEFLAWEASSRDTLDFKRCYVDVAGDLVAGVLLSQIVYWFLPDRKGVSKLTIERGGALWLAKRREEWWDECRITAREFDRAIATLSELGVVETAVFRYGKSTSKHITVRFDILVEKLRMTRAPGTSKAGPKMGSGSSLGVTQNVSQELHKVSFPNCAKRKSGVTPNVIPIQKEESTSETTAEIQNTPLPPPSGGAQRSPEPTIAEELEGRLRGDWEAANRLLARRGMKPWPWEEWIALPANRPGNVVPADAMRAAKRRVLTECGLSDRRIASSVEMAIGMAVSGGVGDWDQVASAMIAAQKRYASLAEQGKIRNPQRMTRFFGELWRNERLWR